MMNNRLPKLCVVAITVLVLFACCTQDSNSIDLSTKYLALKQASVSNADSVMLALKEWEKIATNNTERAEIELIKANVASSRGNNTAAIELTNKALLIHASTTPSILLAEIYNNRGIFYGLAEQQSKSLQDFQQTAKIAESIADTLHWANALNNIGLVLNENGDPNEAIKYLERSKAIAQKANLLGAVTDAATNLAVSYEQQKKYSLAKNVIHQVLSYELLQNDPYYLTITYEHLGYLHLQLKQYDSAFVYLQKAKQLVDKTENVETFLVAYSSLADYYIATNNYDFAIPYSDTVLKASLKHGNLNFKETSLRQLATIYNAVGQPVSAYKKLDSAYQLKDSISDNQRKNKLLADQKNFELAELDKQLEVQKGKLFFNRILAAVLLIALIVTLALVVWALNISRRQKKLINIIELEKLNTEEALNENKKLIAFIAHEIRNPLTGIIGISKMLLKEAPTPDQKEFLTYQLNAGNNLLQLLSQLLDYQKVQSGKQELQLISCSLKDVLKQVYEMYASLIQQKGIEYKILFDNSIPEVLQADPVKLTQIFGNLVNNAIKFCNPSKGEITVTVTLTHSNSTLVTLLCSVRDNGAGISDADKEKIFDLYVQSSKNKSQQLGTGIGLSLVKHYLELMRSKIDIQSTDGRGTTFSFTITLAR